jgi:predicted permease
MIRDLFEALSRLVAVFRRRSLDRDFDEEFAAHLEFLTARNQARGLARDEARRQAILQMGGLGGTKNLHREARGLPRLDRVLEAVAGFGRDLVHAARSLAKAPGFTFVCVMSLSVGMGLVIAIPYGSQLLFMPPTGVKTDGLVEILMTPRGPLRIQVGEWARVGWAYADYADLRDARTGMTLTGWALGESIVTVPSSARVERVPAPTMFVSASYFKTVGVTLMRGRGFDSARPASADRVVVLGYAFWQNRLGSDPEVIGKTVIVNGMQHTVVGIAPEGYCWHLSECRGIQLFAPLETHPRLVANERLRFDRDSVLVRIHGRLSPGVSRVQAHAAVSGVMSALAERYPATNEFKAASVEPYFSIGALERSELTVIQAMFFAVMGMVLLVVCLNISGMMQARSAIRERELAVRLAIGASRGRLVQYLLSEAVMLASVAGAFAVIVLFSIPQLIFWWTGQALPPHVQQHIWQVLRPSLATGALAVGLCLVTSLVFGLLPAIRFSRPTLVSALKDEAAGGGGRRIGRVHRFTAALQVGIAMPFLVVSGTMMDWVRTTTTSDLGFTPDGLAAVAVNLDRAADANDREFLLRRLRDSLEQANGVRSVTVASGLPLDFGFSNNARVSRPDRADAILARITRVGDGYLDTLDIQLVRGRSIGAADAAGAERVAVVSKLVADRLFGADDPIGKLLTLEIEDARREFTVVGVTADFVGRSLDIPRTHVLVPLAQYPTSRVLLVARSAAGVQPAALSPAFRDVVRDVDPEFTLASVMTGDEFKGRGMQDILVPSTMVGSAGVVVLVLAALGIYGVIGFMVATRTREIAVRVALGASRRRVLATVQSDVVRLVIPGVAGGLLLGIVLARMVVPWRGLFGAAMEPLIYLLAVAVAVLVASFAGLPPARRAASIDPMVAMRSE